MAREYWAVYHSYLTVVEELSDAECGRLFKACLQYSRSGEAQRLCGSERILFPGWKSQIDRDMEKYKAKCQTNRANGALGARKRTVAGGSERPPNAPQEKEKEKDKDKEKGKGKGKERERAAKPPPPNFIPPSLEQVRQYCAEKGYLVDCERFFDFYQSKGWMVGKNKMKDWKAALRNWARQDRGTGGHHEHNRAVPGHTGAFGDGYKLPCAFDDLP